MSHYAAGYSKGHSRRLLRKRAREGDISNNADSSQQQSIDYEPSVVIDHPVVNIIVSSSPIASTSRGPIASSAEESSEESSEDDESHDRYLRVIADDEIDQMDVQSCLIDEQDEVEFEEKPKELEVVSELRMWQVKNRVTHKALNELLGTMRKHYGDHFPKSAQTLLRTPRDRAIPTTVLPGQYYHFGLEVGLLSYPHNILRDFKSIVIDIGTDVFQMANSSKTVGWPIFGSIVDTDLDPILIGLYIGKKKPNSIDTFMLPFCEEYQRLVDGADCSSQIKRQVYLLNCTCVFL